MYFFFFFSDLSPEELQIVNATDLGFELPNNFIDNARYQVEEADCTYLAEMPPIIERTILRVLPRMYAIDPITPFFFLKMGILPTWVISWFMTAQLPSRANRTTLFYRSLHAIEHYRRVVFTEDPDDPMEPMEDVEPQAKDDDDGDDDDDDPAPRAKGKGKGKSSLKVGLKFPKSPKKP